jgi:hypothetical protein
MITHPDMTPTVESRFWRTRGIMLCRSCNLTVAAMQSRGAAAAMLSSLPPLGAGRLTETSSGVMISTTPERMKGKRRGPHNPVSMQKSGHPADRISDPGCGNTYTSREGFFEVFWLCSMVTAAHIAETHVRGNLMTSLTSLVAWCCWPRVCRQDSNPSAWSQHVREAWKQRNSRLLTDGRGE